MSSPVAYELDATSDAIDEGQSDFFYLVRVGVNYFTSQRPQGQTTIPCLTRSRTSRGFETTKLPVTVSRPSTRNDRVSIGVSWYASPLILSNAEKQTLAFNIKARVDFKNRKRARMGVWEAFEWLDTLVDESGPDVSGPWNDFSLTNNGMLLYEYLPDRSDRRSC